MTYLGGENSKNFKVTNINSGQQEVLKLDYRLNMPKSIEQYFNKIMPHLFPNIPAQRMVTFPPSKGTKSRARVNVLRTLLVTEYCNNGSVLDYRKKIKSLPEVLNNADDIFLQMTNTFIELQSNNGIFPDSKITNWLIDDDKKLKIFDTKSLLHTDAKGYYLKNHPGNKYAGFLTSHRYNPPEFLKPDKVKADSAHAYLLGCNLYEFLMDKKYESKSSKLSPTLLKMENGQAYQDLITSLLEKDPEKRMSLKEVEHSLLEIKSKKLLSELKLLKFGPNDTKMDNFISKKAQALNCAKKSEKEKVLIELQTLIDNLKGDPAHSYLKKLIKNHRGASTFFSHSKKEKAMIIENTMANVPVEDRSNILNSNSRMMILKTLASPNYSAKNLNASLQKNDIDEEKADKTYKDFKEKFKSALADKKENHSPIKPSN